MRKGDEGGMDREEYKLSYKNNIRNMSSLTVYRSGRQQCGPNYNRGLELRSFYLIHFVIRGHGVFTLNSNTFHINPGEAFLIYPNMHIDKQADGENPWEYCWVGFNGPDARLLVNAAGFTPEMPILRPDPQRMEKLLMDIYAERGTQPYNSINMTARLYTLLAYLVEQNAGHLPEDHYSGVNYVQQACDFIADNYAQDITVTDIADHLNVCRSQLYRIFNRHLSISPQQYLTEFRIRSACSLMATTTSSIKDVALSVGFHDPLYFSSVFKRVIGKTPSNYMEGLRH